MVASNLQIFIIVTITVVFQLEEKLCPRCVCQYEIRNTAVIRLVVSAVLCVLALLVLYMAFLVCLNRGVRAAFAAGKANATAAAAAVTGGYGRVAYHQQCSEEVTITATYSTTTYTKQPILYLLFGNLSKTLGMPFYDTGQYVQYTVLQLVNFHLLKNCRERR